MALADSQRSLAVHFAVPAEATEPTAEQQMPRPSAAESPPTFFELPKPTERSERSERSDVAKRKEEQASKNSKGQELRKALDAQAAKKLDIEEEAKERALLGEPEDDEMLLGEFRQQLLEEHHREQRRIAEDTVPSDCRQRVRLEELVLLRWKLERRKAAEQLRRLYAAELQGLEPPAAHLATPRRISVEDPSPVDQEDQEDGRDAGMGGMAIAMSVSGNIIRSHPQLADESRRWNMAAAPNFLSLKMGQGVWVSLQVSHPLTPDANLQISVDESAELGDESLIEDADPHMQVVQHVLRQLYSACAVRLAEAATPLESTVWGLGEVKARWPVPRVLWCRDQFLAYREAGTKRSTSLACAGYSLQISEDVVLVRQAGSRPIDAALEPEAHGQSRQRLRRYLLMGESRLLEPFLTEAMATYAASKGPVEASEVRRAEVSMVPRPSETSDDNFLSSMTLHLATVPTPIGHGPVRLLDGLRFSLKLDFPMKLFFSEKIMLQYSRWFLASTSYGMTKSGARPVVNTGSTWECCSDSQEQY
eukprot:Skav223527  [mRNA]  locus=scaffold1160:361707:369347:+ [translate_table: standard]